jgi:tetratricopeptide (TPR) repeat protein
VKSEAELAEGDNVAALRDAEVALEFGSPEAPYTLVRARSALGSADPAAGDSGAAATSRPDTGALLGVARSLMREGKFLKARTKLWNAIGRSTEACPDCRRALAEVDERLGEYEDAIVQWEAFASESSDPAAGQEAQARIESLKRRYQPNK